jgi:hypothetical protein
MVREMPRSPQPLRHAQYARLRNAEKIRFAHRGRKNGRWMKLCAIVFAFHQRPIAITGMDGTTTSAHACTIDNATKTPSLAQTRGTAMGRVRTAVVVSFMTAYFVPAAFFNARMSPL